MFCSFSIFFFFLKDQASPRPVIFPGFMTSSQLSLTSNYSGICKQTRRPPFSNVSIILILSKQTDNLNDLVMCFFLLFPLLFFNFFFSNISSPSLILTVLECSLIVTSVDGCETLSPARGLLSTNQSQGDIVPTNQR